jgi:hypothetical protein
MSFDKRAQDVFERFTHDTASHEMTVLHDDGLYRHVRFMNPKSSGYWFDLLTVPGMLVFCGDGDSFVFRRIPDMFAFFRGKVGRIDPHYWSEKLAADPGSVMAYDQDLFEQQVKEHVADAIRYRAAPRGISRAVKNLLENGDITWEGGARRELEQFEFSSYRASCWCGANELLTDDIDATGWGYQHARKTDHRHGAKVEPLGCFTFDDTLEWSFRDYHWWFLWACHAIVWGIARYDAAKTPAAVGGAA